MQSLQGNVCNQHPALDLQTYLLVFIRFLQIFYEINRFCTKRTFRKSNKSRKSVTI